MTKPGGLTAMISSTSIDLPDHRRITKAACMRLGIFPIAMEELPARDADAIRVSMEMVEKADLYIGIFAWRYGHVPAGHNISITEMEFDRAVERGIPILVFVIHKDHLLRISMVEIDNEAQKKLAALKERASRGRGRREFKSAEELFGEVLHALADFKEREKDNAETTPASSPSNPFPKAPAFYAQPDYIGSHKFVGRDSQLQELSDWAKPADPKNLLLFEAIGGNGKSMLTWEWATNPKYALAARPSDSPWAGRFWYSFYERGAFMADFCQRALAYMTGRPLEEFAKKRTAELKPDLLAQLHARPWLVILDGLERVLVAYHRIDAAEVPDEEANAPTDKIVNRNPRDAIRDEDNDLLRALAGAKPSKILVSSRLTPRVLLNPAGQAIQGARRIDLPGLRPSDAEAVLRSCGREKDGDPDIRGDSAAIQAYLTENCDNHPLVIGVLGGLINNYLPDRGNFDAWAADPDGGANLELASLDLTQRRNHILRAALDKVALASRQLLETLVFLSESVDFETLRALNPHLPANPIVLDRPHPPEADREQQVNLTEEEKAGLLAQDEATLELDQDAEKARQAGRETPEHRTTQKTLTEAVADLERRGLVQWDGGSRRYSLHPVVRGVVAGGMKKKDKESCGQRVLNHFSSLPRGPYEQTETLEDLRADLHVIRALLKLGRYRHAADALPKKLAVALHVNLEAYAEALSLLRPLFPRSWGELPQGVGALPASILASFAALALDACGEPMEALVANGAALDAALEVKSWEQLTITLFNISESLWHRNLLAKCLRVCRLALDLDTVRGEQAHLFTSRLALFEYQSRLGRWDEAEVTWERANPMGRDWPRDVYHLGGAERAYAEFQFLQGKLREEDLTVAEQLAAKGRSRGIIRDLLRLRGCWRLEHGDWSPAVTSLAEAVRMARERSLPDAESETGLALAKFRLGQLSGDDAHREAERLAQLRQPAHRYLAMLWQAIGDHDRAKHHTLAAYEWAWADGEPYVNRYELTKTTELLQQLNVIIPNLPPYDAAKDEPFPWETDVRAAIEKLKAEKEAESKGEGQDEASRP